MDLPIGACKQGSLCLCVDYRRLNTVTEDDRYPMPRVDELLEKLGKSTYISTLDLAKVPVAREDQAKTAFMTPMGKYQFLKMPFELKGAPTTFQRLLDTVLSPCHNYASSYIDDIGVFSDSWEEHLDHLRDVLTKLREADLKAKAKKYQLAMEEGHYLGKGRIHLEKAKVDAIATFRIPKNKEGHQGLSGLNWLL